jgi:hypothetical protein
MELAFLADEADAAVTGDLLADLDENRLGDRVAGELTDGLIDFLVGHAGRGGVPEAEGGDLVAMDILGGLNDLREARNLVTGFRVQRAAQLKHDAQV